MKLVKVILFSVLIAMLSTPAWAVDLEISYHSILNIDNDISTRQTLPEIKLSHGLNNNWRAWASVERNDIYGNDKYMFELLLPGFGAGYVFKHDIIADFGIHLPITDNYSKKGITGLYPESPKTSRCLQPPVVDDSIKSVNVKTKPWISLAVKQQLQLTESVSFQYGGRIYHGRYSLVVNGKEDVKNMTGISFLLGFVF